MDGGIRGLLLLLFLHSGGALELNVPSSYRVGVGSETWIPCTFTVDKPPVDPKYFAVFWSFKGNEILSYNDFVKTEDPRFSLNTENSLNGNASLSISRVKIFDEGVYTCSILYSPERKEKKVTLHVQAPPEITITKSIVIMNQQSILRAAITGFYPVDINVKWLKDGKMLDRVKVSRPQRNPDDTYSVNSTVAIKPTEEDKHRTFSCRVQHESLSGPLHKDFQLEFAVSPEINITGRLVVLNQESVLSCLITGFYPEDIDVKWLKDEKMLDRVSVSRPQRKPDGTYSVNSTVTITPTEEDRNQTFSCRVRHESLSGPLHTDFQLEFAVSPEIKITGRVAVLNQESVLSCSITGFYPEDIDVKWLKDGKMLDGVSVSRPQRNPDDTYSVNSTVTITPTEEVMKRTFSCWVQHESLSGPLHADFQLEFADEDRTSTTVISVIVVAVVVLVVLAILAVIFLVWKKKQKRPTRRDENREAVPLMGGEMRTEERTEERPEERRSVKQCVNKVEERKNANEAACRSPAKQTVNQTSVQNSKQKNMGGPSTFSNPELIEKLEKVIRGKLAEKEDMELKSTSQKPSTTASHNTERGHKTPNTSSGQNMRQDRPSDQQAMSGQRSIGGTEAPAEAPKQGFTKAATKTGAKPSQGEEVEEEQTQRNALEEEKAENAAETSSESTRHVQQAPGTHNEEDPSIRESLEEQHKESNICKEEAADPQRGTPPECPKHVHGEPRAETEGEPPETKAGEKEQRQKKPLEKEKAETSSESTRHDHRAPGTQNEEEPSIGESLKEQHKESDICKEEGADPQRGTPPERPKHVHGEPRAETEGDTSETKAGGKEQREKKPLKKEKAETSSESTRHVHRAPGTQNEEDPSIRESLGEQEKESDICKEEAADPQRGTPAECPKHIHGEPRAETEGDPPEMKAGEQEQRERKPLKKE